MMQTIWTSAPNFLDMYYGRAESKSEKGDQLECFKILFREINQRMPGE
jgi:hypothetical protein